MSQHLVEQTYCPTCEQRANDILEAITTPLEFYVIYHEDRKPNGKKGDLRVSSRSPFTSLYEAQKYAAPIDPGRNAKVLVKATQGVELLLASEYAKAHVLEKQVNEDLKLRIKKLKAKLRKKRKSNDSASLLSEV
jgi:hypothetical protein